MSPELLAQVFDISVGRANGWVVPLGSAAACYDIDTPLRLAAFLAQIGHESGGLSRLEENLFYSADALMLVWPKHFDSATAAACAHHPRMIANIAYAGRMGNGNASSDDGWRYRGRGLLQLTGRDDYAACGRGLGIDLLGTPDLLFLPEHASMSAAWEWNRGGLNLLADHGKFEQITRIINGGLIGQAAREKLYERCKSALGLS